MYAFFLLYSVGLYLPAILYEKVCQQPADGSGSPHGTPSYDYLQHQHVSEIFFFEYGVKNI